MHALRGKCQCYSDFLAGIRELREENVLWSYNRRSCGRALTWSWQNPGLELQDRIHSQYLSPVTLILIPVSALESVRWSLIQGGTPTVPFLLAPVQNLVCPLMVACDRQRHGGLEQNQESPGATQVDKDISEQQADDRREPQGAGPALERTVSLTAQGSEWGLFRDQFRPQTFPEPWVSVPLAWA